MNPPAVLGRGVVVNAGDPAPEPWGATPEVLVDEAALVRALADGTIKAAGLDVFEDEPNVPSALLAMDNVVLLPHVGSATRETRQAMGDLCKANLDAWFSERRTLTLIPELA